MQRPTFNNLYAIFTEGGGVQELISSTDTTEREYIEGEMIVHCDDKDQVWAIVFEDTDTAEHVRQEYIDATGDSNVEVKPTLATSVEEHHNYRLYRYDGEWEDITHKNYIERMLVD